MGPTKWWGDSNSQHIPWLKCRQLAPSTNMGPLLSLVGSAPVGSRRHKMTQKRRELPNY